MVSEGTLDPMELVKEKTPTEYVGYATGRQNVAFSDLRVTLNKRHNPAGRIGEEAVGFVFESQPAPRERVEVTSFAFDGREHDLAPLLSAEKDASSAEKEPEKKKKETFGSTYDNFVFAIVHKDMMKKVRDGRYDLSLTNTKEHSRLPFWTVLMSESAEISEALLTPELCDAVKRAGDLLEMLIVTDQPEDQPKKFVTPHQPFEAQTAGSCLLYDCMLTALTDSTMLSHVKSYISPSDCHPLPSRLLTTPLFPCSATSSAFLTTLPVSRTSGPKPLSA